MNYPIPSKWEEFYKLWGDFTRRIPDITKLPLFISNNQVGIGTTQPATYASSALAPLVVSGGVWISGSSVLGGRNMTALTTTGTGTWTPPTGLGYVKVTLVGGGGSGGVTAAGVNDRGGGGGGGGTAIIFAYNITSSASITYVVGSGGLGGTATAHGGNSVWDSVTASGGQSGTADNGGVGGGASGGSINVGGGGGNTGGTISGLGNQSGSGGSSTHGGGGAGITGSSSTGTPGQNYGGGGGGQTSGAQGIIILEA